jgi:hypothetical protein
MGNSTDEEFAEHYASWCARSSADQAGPPDRGALLRPADDEMERRRGRHQGLLRRHHPHPSGRRLDHAQPPHDLEMPGRGDDRTKHVGLLYKQLVKDSAKSRGGMPDYLITFIKPGDNAELIAHARTISRSSNGRNGPRRSG